MGGTNCILATQLATAQHCRHRSISPLPRDSQPTLSTPGITTLLLSDHVYGKPSAESSTLTFRRRVNVGVETCTTSKFLGSHLLSRRLAFHTSTALLTTTCPYWLIAPVSAILLAASPGHYIQDGKTMRRVISHRIRCSMTHTESSPTRFRQEI